MKNHNDEYRFITDILNSVKTRLYEIAEDVNEENPNSTEYLTIKEARAAVRTAMEKIESARLYKGKE